MISDRLERIENKLDDVQANTARNTASLEEHMRRTDILEAEIKPLKTHVIVVAALAKIVAFAGAVVGLVAGIAKLRGH